jgi:uncharacterized protein with gpF-like domain
MLACDALPRKPLRNAGRKAVTLAPVRPNAGLTAAYNARLTRVLDEMHASLTYWLRAAYRANTPEMAQDKSPARALQDAFRRLARRWLSRFDKLAPEMAAWFAKGVADRSDAALRGSLKRAGFAVEFKLTKEVNDVFQGVLGEQVSLIKSIAQRHLSEVEGLVNRSVQQGRDLGYLAKELEDRYGVTKRRAAFIARDQNNKSTAVITRTRQQSLGIQTAQWVHSAGGRKPRPEHVKAGVDRLVYEVTKGAYLEGVWTWPGHEINCRCVSRSVIPGFA